MKIPFWYIYTLHSLTTAAVISPLSLLNTSEIVDPVAEWPVVGNLGGRFKMEAVFMGPKLPLISCLMITVEFLVVLGLQYFPGNMGEVAWKLDSYPHVGMVVKPLTADKRIGRRFVIWGLGAGATYMIHLNRFEAVTFILSCTYTPTFSFSTQITLEVVRLIPLEGIMYRSHSSPSTCLLT